MNYLMGKIRTVVLINPKLRLYRDESGKWALRECDFAGCGIVEGIEDEQETI